MKLYITVSRDNSLRFPCQPGQVVVPSTTSRWTSLDAYTELVVDLGRSYPTKEQLAFLYGEPDVRGFRY